MILKSWMKMGLTVLGTSILSLSGSSQPAAAQDGISPALIEKFNVKPNIPSKKLIEYGWDVPSPAYVRDNIRSMEKKPFDGIMFRLENEGGQIFNSKAWDETKLQPQMAALGQIKWDKFTDNFLMMYASSDMDWFSDSDWKTVLSHAKFMARAAKAAGCKGLVFDPEPYGKSPWTYSEQKYSKEKSYGEYARMARRRGNQFMAALSSEMPAIKLFMFYQFSMPYTFSSHDPDPLKRARALSNNGYGLMNPFLDGVLETAGPQAKLIDGNEFSYYYKTPGEFFESYQMMRQKAKQYVAPELRPKFDSHVEAAQALYVDYVFNLRPDIFPGGEAVTMTPEERARRFEQNVYYALKSTDEYAWIYSENMNWWKNEYVPPGLEDAVISARKKIRDDQEFGLLSRTATIKRVPAGQIPKIDGVLDDALYAQLKTLDPFVRYYNSTGDLAPVKAPTQTWVAYDDKNLYVAFRNSEPIIEQLKIHGPVRDSEVWLGDSVEISIQPDPKESSFYHFILNAANTQWDADDELGLADLSFNPKWQSATSRGTNEWIVEAAIPWSELKLKVPQTGTTLRANLARLRTPMSELTSWSQFQSGFQEVHNFGTWIFE